MALITLNPADIANAQLGINLPLLYGYGRVRGNEVLNHTLSNKNRIVIRICCEGEADGIDTLFINSKKANQLDTALVHFHPGIDGELGHGLTPDSNGGDQRVDNFWSQLPANFIPTTFSRKCYLMFNVPPDPAAPSATLDIVFDLRGLKVRQFDASGNQTAYSFSTNGAWQSLDAILRSMLKPEWNPSAAAAGGGDLTADEKARIDFASFADSAAWCDTALAGGQKRFESSLAIVQSTSLMDVLNQLCLMSQLFIHEDSGKIYCRADKPRASTFVLTSDHVVAGKAEFDKLNLRGAKNRFIGSYNDLNAQDIADTETPANSGLVRSGTGVVTVKTKTNHPFLTNGFAQVVGPSDGSTHDFAFDGIFRVASVPAANQFTYAQSGLANWLLWSEDFSNAAWQSISGTTVTANNQTDPLGGNTADTLTAGTTGTVWGMFQTCGLPVLNGRQFTFSVWLKAAANKTVRVQVGSTNSTGDAESTNVTVTTAWQRFTFTHSASWPGGAGSAQAVIALLTASDVVFAWGAQMEDGTAATTYRQTTSATSGVTSGNGYIGTPESRFAVRAPVVDHEQHQKAIGQRGINLTPIFRVAPVNISLGNNTDERVRRVMNFMKTRSLGADASPYIAPWSGKVTCYMDAVDTSLGVGNFRALIAQLCGDILTVAASVSEEYQGDYEITKALFNIPAHSSSSGGLAASGDEPTIELTLLQYLSGAFSDTSLAAQSLKASISSGLDPIAAVDSTGVQRLAGTFKNNPTNVMGYYTGANPLSQSGTSTLILVAAFVIQFGDGQVSYSSGSVNPGSLGTWAVYARDPMFAGGTVTFFAVLATSKSSLTQFNDIVFLGSITTAAGGGGLGTGGGGGSCFSGNVEVRVPGGLAKFEDLPLTCEIETEAGPRIADLIVTDYAGPMLDMGDRRLVTPGHRFKQGSQSWVPASEIWAEVTHYEGKVYTLRVRTDRDEERHFILDDGSVAHNVSNLP